MGIKEELEKSILQAYEAIHANENQLLFASPKEKMRLQRENDELWIYIENWLAQYTALCERTRVMASPDIVQIAIVRAPALHERLTAAGSTARFPVPPAYPAGPVPTTPQSPYPVGPAWTPPAVPSAPPPIPVAPTMAAGGMSPFRMNTHLVRQYAPMDKDALVQAAVTFSNRGDIDFSEVDVTTHICLVLDVSGSMDRPDKYPYLLQAIPYVIDGLSDNDWISIVLFSGRSQVVWSQAVEISRKQKGEITARVDQSGVKFGRTYLTPGLRLAIDEITHFFQNHPEAVTRLYILTDGQLHDAAECRQLNPELRRLEIEVNSYGFGEDFAEESMRQIMEGCPGGRVQHIKDSESLYQRFYHTGAVAQDIIATDAELEIEFSTQVTPGDIFRFDPGTHWYGAAGGNKRFRTRIGSLERERVYIYAFEGRVHPGQAERERVATVALEYTFQGQRHTIKQEVLVDRTKDAWRCEQVDKHIEYLFLVLDALRNDDPNSLLESFQARLQILSDEGGDPEQISLLSRAILKLQQDGILEGLSEFELRRLRVDNATQVGR